MHLFMLEKYQIYRQIRSTPLNREYQYKFVFKNSSDVFIFFAVLFIVIGIAVFGGKMEQMGYSVGWSMGLAIAGVVLAFFAGIMEVLELR